MAATEACASLRQRMTRHRYAWRPISAASAVDHNAPLATRGFAPIACRITARPLRAAPEVLVVPYALRVPVVAYRLPTLAADARPAQRTAARPRHTQPTLQLAATP